MCLAMGCDMRFASASATFNATGIVNGLTSTEMAAAWLLPRQIGATNANDLLLTGRVVDAPEALRLGLVSRVAADDDVLGLAVSTAEGMAGFSPYGLAMTKDVLWANLEISSMAAAIELEDRNQLMLGFTENLPEAIRAFDAGRPPVYTDEPRKDIYGG
jgi:enoyl-CoA hydratase